MKKNINPQVKANVATGMSSAIGAAAGVVAGSAIADNVNAQDVEAIPTITPETEVAEAENVPTVAVADSEDEVQVVVSEPEAPVTPVAQPEVQTVSQTEMSAGQEPRVVAYGTVDNGDGSQADVAIVEAGGQQVAIVDLDQDGRADIGMADINGNGMLDEGEVEDISGYGIAMQPLAEAANTPEQEWVAQTADIDYTNDANVDAYYA